MQISFMRWAWSVLFLSTSIVGLAQDHVHTPRHGGQVLEAAGHHVEVVSSGDEYAFYLSDSSGIDVPVEGISGTAYLRFADRTTANVLIEPHPKKGYLCIVLTNSADLSMLISLKVRGTWVNVQYEGVGRALATPIEQHGSKDGHQH